MPHPNTQLLEKIYGHFSAGQFEEMFKLCADEISFQIPGKSPLAGKFTKANFVSNFVVPMMERSGGSLKVEVHDILASDRHAVVLASDHLERGGKKIQLRTAHVWRIENGKPVAFYEYPRDLYAFDATWT